MIERTFFVFFYESKKDFETSVTLASRVVSHRNTNKARSGLTSPIRREVVFYTRYEPTYQYEELYIPYIYKVSNYIDQI